MSAAPIRFLSLDNILEIHTDTITAEGGSFGLRDIGLLQSAIAMPHATYSGQYLHDGLSAMAAAYLLHICQNHAFVDGNKRTASYAMVLFLSANGIDDASLPAPEKLETVTMAVASSQMSKSEITECLRSLYPQVRK